MYVILAVVFAFALFSGSDAACTEVNAVTDIVECTQDYSREFANIDLSNSANKEQVCNTARTAYSSLESCISGLKSTYPSCASDIDAGLNQMSASKQQIDDACGAAAISISLFTLLAMLLTHFLSSN